MFVEIRLHARLGADACEGLFELLAQVRIFFVVGYRGTAIFHVDGAVIDGLFSGAPAIASGRIGAEPSGESERFLARAKVSVKPVAAHRRRTDHSHRLVVLTSDFFRRAFLPWMGAQLGRPGIGVALAAKANEHGGGTMGMRL